MSLLAPGPVLTQPQVARLKVLEETEEDARVVGVDWQSGDPIIEREGGRRQRVTEGGRMAPAGSS